MSYATGDPSAQSTRTGAALANPGAVASREPVDIVLFPVRTGFRGPAQDRPEAAMLHDDDHLPLPQLSQPDPRLERYARSSAATFVVALVLCTLLAPDAARDDNGISYFLHIGPALPPFVVGVLAVAAISIQVASRLPSAGDPWRLLRLAFSALPLLLVGILVTPDYVNQWFNVAHVTVSVILFAGQFALSGWLTLVIWRDRINIGLFAALLAVGLLALTSEIHLTGLLFESEAVFQVIFVAIIARIAKLLQPVHGGIQSSLAVAYFEPRLACSRSDD
jgi:hypothetical protein